MPKKQAPILPAGAVLVDTHTEDKKVTALHDMFSHVSREDIQKLLAHFENDGDMVSDCILNNRHEDILTEWDGGKKDKKDGKKKKAPATATTTTAAAPAAVPAAAAPAPPVTPKKAEPAKEKKPEKVEKEKVDPEVLKKQKAEKAEKDKLKAKEALKADIAASTGAQVAESGMRKLDINSLMNQTAGALSSLTLNGAAAVSPAKITPIGAHNPNAIKVIQFEPPAPAPVVQVTGPAGDAIRLANDILGTQERTLDAKWTEAKAELTKTFQVLSQALLERQMRLQNEMDMSMFQEARLIGARKTVLRQLTQQATDQTAAGGVSPSLALQLESFVEASKVDLPAWGTKRFMADTAALGAAIASFGRIDNKAAAKGAAPAAAPAAAVPAATPASATAATPAAPTSAPAVDAQGFTAVGGKKGGKGGKAKQDGAPAPAAADAAAPAQETGDKKPKEKKEKKAETSAAAAPKGDAKADDKPKEKKAAGKGGKVVSEAPKTDAAPAAAPAATEAEALGGAKEQRARGGRRAKAGTD